MRRLIFTTAIIALLISMTAAQTTQRRVAKSDKRESSDSVHSAAATNPVAGGGTPGRISKWTGVFGSSTFTLGDSNIFEDKFGNVGIGTDSPTSKLTVAGTIEASGGSSILHNLTLTGNGTTARPLGVAVPLFLKGAVPIGAIVPAVVDVINTEQGGTAITGRGGSLTTGIGSDNGGVGVEGIGGFGLSTADFGGVGVSAIGGASGGTGGAGVQAIGGGGGGDITSHGGAGVRALGGASTSGAGAPGVIGTGGVGGAVTGTGVIGHGGDSETGVGGDGIQGFAGRGHAPGFEGAAGSFFGDVVVSDDLSVEGDITAHGNLTAFGVKQFKIDHPLNPENKYLYHAAIESSEVLNIYSGNVVTNATGEAVIALPDWFEAINRDFRYQLTVVGTFAQAIVADEIQNNQFKIRSSAPGVKVSWQVTGVRSDAGIRRHPFKAEEDKPERERGTYLIPEAFGQPEDRGVEWALRPEAMRLMKETRTRRMEELKQKAGNSGR
ncbi:MAG TPA: hypothetical protein VGV87_02005 [Blastocatellia bacterium]|jgi:hypothetical protein|nr:hypothetical protein [Blastocatellia bacterium]